MPEKAKTPSPPAQPFYKRTTQEKPIPRPTTLAIKPLTGTTYQKDSHKLPKVHDPYKPKAVLSGVEKSSDITAPLMKFPTLPVNIPNFFGTPNASSLLNLKQAKKDKKKSQVPEDAVEAVLADSMTVAAAVAMPFDPCMAQMSKAKDSFSPVHPVPPPRRNSKENGNSLATPTPGSVERSTPVSISKLRRQSEVDLSDNSPEPDVSSSSFEKVEKSPLRSILKKSTPSSYSHASSTDFSENLPADETFEDEKPVKVIDKNLLALSSSPSKVSFAEPIVSQAQADTPITFSEKPLESTTKYEEVTTGNDPLAKCSDIKITVEQPVSIPGKMVPEIIDAKPAVEEIKPKSMLSALIENTEKEDVTDSPSNISTASIPPPSPKSRKQVTLQIPEDNQGTTKPKPPNSPVPKKGKSTVKNQPQLQYNIPESSKAPKVGGQRSRKPTLASQWRIQKEKLKLEEQVLQDRINTYSEDWPFLESDSSVPAVTVLAEAGFHFMGLNDSVQCSACDVILNGWKERDEKDPWVQHAKTNPNCPFLEKSKGASWIQETVG